MIKRLLYLAYYFRELDKVKLASFMNHVSRKYNLSKFRIWTDIIRSSMKYNISILEYFQFHFYRMPQAERASFAGTGYMYEYQLLMNPKSARMVLEDKLLFLKEYGEFVKHDFASLADLQNERTAARLLSNRSGKVVLKSSDGQCGIGVEVKDVKDLTPAALIQRMKETSNDLVEEFVIQHDELMRLSPSGLNTIRIITQLNEHDEVDIIGARLRISVNSSVDNLAAGNIAAPIDVQTGKVEGNGVYSDITRNEEAIHPVTGVPIRGFQVPFWPETVSMIKRAALKNKNNRSIGWDIAITNQGPELIEGNHDWCKLLWQLPVKKGLRPVLESYLSQRKQNH